MEASCGPNNAVTKLAQHSQRDNSLQNEFIARNQPGSGRQGFRQGQGVDANLNHEFQQFNSGSDFASSFMSSGGFNVPQQQHHHQHPNQHHQGHQNPHWVQDFAGLSIQNKPQSTQSAPAVQSDWHRQFMQQNGQASHVQTLQDQTMAPAHYDAGYMNAPRFQMNMRTNLSTPLYAQHAGQQGMHHQQFDFDSQFDELEKELEAQQTRANTEEATAETTASIDTEEKERFARTAQKVEASMKASQSTDTDMNTKIQNSQFLKLMNSIGNRRVELEGDKLVDAASGQDVRDRGLDDVQPHEPHVDTDTANHRAHAHMTGGHGVSPVSADQAHQNTLPDPLAHIKDGALGDITEPLLAAQVVSGNQVQAGDWMEDDMWNARPKNSILSPEWQEVYDDYRHDDDHH